MQIFHKFEISVNLILILSTIYIVFIENECEMLHI